MQASGKALIYWENHEIEKYASRLRQFDTFETPSMNVYGNDSIFIIIFGSGYSNWREICGKLIIKHDYTPYIWKIKHWSGALRTNVSVK